MAQHTYKKIEIVGTSGNSIEDAVQNAVSRASHTLNSLRWIEVVETRGEIQDNRVATWQVTVKIGFTLDDARD